MVGHRAASRRRPAGRRCPLSRQHRGVVAVAGTVPADSGGVGQGGASTEHEPGGHRRTPVCRPSPTVSELATPPTLASNTRFGVEFGVRHEREGRSRVGENLYDVAHAGCDLREAVRVGGGGRRRLVRGRRDELGRADGGCGELGQGGQGRLEREGWCEPERRVGRRSGERGGERRRRDRAGGRERGGHGRRWPRGHGRRGGSR